MLGVEEKHLAGLTTIFNKLAQDCPGVGKRVKVLKGKWKNREGIVFWHGKKPHDYSDKYVRGMSAHASQIRGVLGYRVGIKSGEEKFFVDASNVQII